jgi:hypothetical protein
MIKVAAPLHEILMSKYPKACERCNIMMSPQYIKVVHKNTGEYAFGTIHYVCDKCGVEFDLYLNGEDGPDGTVDPQMGVVL